MKNDLETAEALYDHALECQTRGEYDEAENLYKRALGIREEVLGEHSDTAITLYKLATMYNSFDRLEEAEELYNRALEICKKVLGAHQVTADTLNGLALLHDKQGMFEEAEELYKKAIEIYEEVQHINIVKSLNNLIGLYKEQERHEEAKVLQNRAREVKEILGAESFSKEQRQDMNYDFRDYFWDDVGKTGSDDIASYKIDPEIKKQLPWPDLRLSYRRILTEDSVIIATDGLSDEFSDSELPDNGLEIELYIEMNDPEFIKMSLAQLGETWVFGLLNQAALNAVKQGNYKNLTNEVGVFSFEYYDVGVPEEYISSEGTVGALIGMQSKKVPFQTKLTVSEVLFLSVTLLKLEELQYILKYGDVGRKEIVKRLEQAEINNISSTNRENITDIELERKENVQDIENKDVADNLLELASQNQDEGQYEEAEELYKRALEIYEDELGEEHLYTAFVLNDLAMLYDEQERYKEAEKLYKRAVKIFENNLENDSITATTLSGLADLYKNQGMNEEAEKCYKRAIEILEEVWETEAQQIQLYADYYSLSEICKNQGRNEEAEKLFDRALEIAKEE